MVLVVADPFVSFSGRSMLIARGKWPGALLADSGGCDGVPMSTSAFLVASPSGSMLEARRFRGDEERWGRSASPFMTAALLDAGKGDVLRAGFSGEPTSLSVSRDGSPRSEAVGESEAAEAAYSARACVCSRGGRLEAGRESARRYEGVSGPGPMEGAEKESAGSSSGSHEGRAVSGEGESGDSGSWFWSGRASFLFFEEDVLKVSCPGSSGVNRLRVWGAGEMGRRGLFGRGGDGVGDDAGESLAFRLRGRMDDTGDGRAFVDLVESQSAFRAVTTTLPWARHSWDVYRGAADCWRCNSCRAGGASHVLAAAAAAHGGSGGEGRSRR